MLKQLQNTRIDFLGRMPHGFGQVIENARAGIHQQKLYATLHVATLTRNHIICLKPGTET